MTFKQLGDGPTEGTVSCDDDCGALVDPGTSVYELQRALEHWMGHWNTSGCAHGW